MLSTEQRHEAARRYGKRLAEALEANGISVNRLAKKMSPEQPESARRTLHRYLSGTNLPGIEQRSQLAEQLECSDLRSVPSVDEDDEEGRSQVAPSLAEALQEMAAIAALLNEHPNLRAELEQKSEVAL